MASEIAVVHQKGGVLKTTSVVNVGVALAALGYNVVNVDVDPQCHQARSLIDRLGYAPDELFNVVTGRTPVHQALLPVAPEKVALDTPAYLPRKSPHPGRLDILPGHLDTGLIPQWMRSRNQNWLALAEQLAPLHDTHDFILFDTPPTVSELTPAVVGAIRYALIPTEPEELSVRQINDVIDSLHNLSHLNEVEVLGIVPTKARLNTGLHKLYIEDLKAEFGDLVWVAETITLSTIWAEASSSHMSVMQYAAATNQDEHKAVSQAWALTARILETIGVTA